MRRLLNNVMIFALLALVFGLPVLLVDRFQETGPELLNNPSFAFGNAGWLIQGEESAVTITANVLELNATDATRSINVSQENQSGPCCFNGFV